jgi:GDP-mannose 6-dehydrogenase
MLPAIDTRDEAVIRTDVTFLMVGTPETAYTRVDLHHVVRACEEIGRALKRKKTFLMRLRAKYEPLCR